MISLIKIKAILFSMLGYGIVCQAMEATVYDDIPVEGVKVYKTLSNKKFAEQVNERNTIYVIKKNFNLKGETVFIPAGCELRFEGGSIRNGTLVLNGTLIGGNKLNSVFSTVKVKGRVAGVLDAKWFKEKVDIESLLAIADNEVSLLQNEIYQLYGNLEIPHSNIIIDGKGSKIIYQKDGIHIVLKRTDDVILRNVHIDGNNRTSSGVFAYQCNRVRFENVSLKNISWDNNTNRTYCYGIEVMASKDVLFDRCTIEDVKATPTSHVAAGIAINVSGEGETSKNITIRDCRIGRIWSDNNGVGLGADCVVLAGRYEKERDINAVIDHCEFFDFTKRAVKAQAENVKVKNCTFSLTSFMNDKENPKYVIEIFGSHSTVNNNSIFLKDKECYIGIGIYSYGKAMVCNGKVIFDETELTQDVIIKDNVIVAGELGYGVFVGIPDRCDANLYSNISITGNTIRGDKSLWYGIRAMDSMKGCDIEENIIDNANIGIWLNSVEKCVKKVVFFPEYNDIIIKNNRIRGAAKKQQYGVCFDKVSNSSICGNVVSCFNNGILLGNNKTALGINNCLIKGNAISDCSWGIETDNQCSAVNIQYNVFKRCKVYDMVLQSDNSKIFISDNVNAHKVFQVK